MRPPPCSQIGTTLTELLTAVTVGIVLTAIALPGMSSALRYHDVSSAARSVSTALFVAKSRAATRFTHARVRIDPGGRTLVTEILDRTTGEWQAAGQPAVLANAVTFGFGAATSPPEGRAALAQNEPVEFNSRGIPVDPATSVPQGDRSIYVTNGEDTLGVLLSIGGRVTILRHRDGAWVPF